MHKKRRNRAKQLACSPGFFLIKWHSQVVRVNRCAASALGPLDSAPEEQDRL
jgi:hypothetical protein